MGFLQEVHGGGGFQHRSSSTCETSAGRGAEVRRVHAQTQSSSVSVSKQSNDRSDTTDWPRWGLFDLSHRVRRRISDLCTAATWGRRWRTWTSRWPSELWRWRSWRRRSYCWINSSCDLFSSQLRLKTLLLILSELVFDWRNLSLQLLQCPMLAAPAPSEPSL